MFLYRGWEVGIGNKKYIIVKQINMKLELNYFICIQYYDSFQINVCKLSNIRHKT